MWQKITLRRDPETAERYRGNEFVEGDFEQAKTFIALQGIPEDVLEMFIMNHDEVDYSESEALVKIWRVHWDSRLGTVGFVPFQFNEKVLSNVLKDKSDRATVQLAVMRDPKNAPNVEKSLKVLLDA